MKYRKDSKVSFVIGIIIALAIFGFNFTGFDGESPLSYLIAFSVILMFLSRTLQKRKFNKNTENNQTNDTANKCRECGAQVNYYDTACSNCGTVIEKEVICDYCGTSNSPDDLMCKKCNGLLK